MGNRPSFMLQDEEITLISEETGFSSAQIERLYSRFTALDKGGNGSLSRQDCLAIPELAINPLCDRIVHMFFIDCDEDHERINFRQFMNVLATFRSSHKSSPLSRSRNVSRQESLNQQQQQSIMKQAPLLFDTIDPTSLSALSRHHSRHSSYHDGFHDNFHHNHNGHHHHHHTTNQHSIHYAASSTHLPQLSNGLHLHHRGGGSGGGGGGGGFGVSTGGSGGGGDQHHNPNHHNSLYTNGGSRDSNSSGKKMVQLPLIDPDEPLNSRKQKLFFMFKIYDVNDDDLVDLEDLVAILKMMVGTYVDDARVRRIAERTLREADKDCDGYIDFEEFCAAFSRKDIEESLRVNFRIHSDL